MRYGLLFAMLTVLLLAASPARAAEPERLSYEEFLQKVQDDKIKSVTLGPLHYVSGTYLQGKVQTEFFSQRPLDAGNDPLLNKLLETHKVSVVTGDPRNVKITTPGDLGLAAAVIRTLPAPGPKGFQHPVAEDRR